MPAVLMSDAVLLNADTSHRVVSHAARASWAPCGAPGISQRLLDAIPGEQGWATALVRMAPGASGRPPGPLGAEEIFVLEGRYADSTGLHDAGTFLHNPPGRAEAPHTPDGCLLFVKRWQALRGDGGLRCVDTRCAVWAPGAVPGVWLLPLHEQGGQRSHLVRSAPHTWFDTHTHPVGEEILVLEGVLHDDLDTYPRHSWLRNPRWSRHAPHTGAEGALALVRVGHMAPQSLQAPPSLC